MRRSILGIEAGSAAGRRQAAGWFLEQAGAKELSVGHARLYEKHANIIIADKKATATDVYALMQEMRKRVQEKFRSNLSLKLSVSVNFQIGHANE